MFSLSHNEKARDLIDTNESIMAYVQILAKKLFDEREKHEEVYSADELDFEPKQLSQRGGSDIDIIGASDDEPFVLEDEPVKEAQVKEGSNGGFRDYSVTHKLHDHLSPSYVAFTSDGIPIKTFFHAKTFKDKLKKSRRRILVQPKKSTGSVHRIALSTVDQTAIKEYQSCRMINLSHSAHPHTAKRVTVNEDIESEDLIQSVIAVSRHDDDDEIDPVEFDSELYANFRLNKSLSPPSIGFSPRDISVTTHSSNMLSPYGRSPNTFSLEYTMFGFTHFTNHVHFLPSSPPIMIGVNQQSLPQTPVSIVLGKKTDMEIIEMNKASSASTNTDSEMIYTHKQIQNAANADISVPKPLTSPYSKPPSLIGNRGTDKNSLGMKPKKTNNVEEDLKTVINVFKKPPVPASNVTCSVNRARSPEVDQRFLFQPQFKEDKPIKVDITIPVGLRVRKQPKNILKWSSQGLLDDQNLNDVWSPSSKESKKQKSSATFLPISNRLVLKSSGRSLTIHKDKSDLLKDVLSRGPIRQFVSQLTRDSSSLLCKAESLDFDITSLSSMQSLSRYSRHLFKKNSEIKNTFCDSSKIEEIHFPRSLDLLTDKPMNQLVSGIKDVLIQHNLDPFAVDNPLHRIKIR